MGAQSGRDPYRNAGSVTRYRRQLSCGIWFSAERERDSSGGEKYGYWRDERSAGDQPGVFVSKSLYRCFSIRNSKRYVGCDCRN